MTGFIEGSGELAVDCEHLDASIEGVGSLTLSGKAKSAQISKDGIGSVSTRRLKSVNKFRNCSIKTLTTHEHTF